MDGCVGFFPHSNDTGFGASIVTESGFANWRSFSTPRQLTVGEWFLGPVGLDFSTPLIVTRTERERAGTAAGRELLQSAEPSVGSKTAIFGCSYTQFFLWGSTPLEGPNNEILAGA